MSTLLGDKVETGNVLEIKSGEDWVSALVLLANEDFVILDLCDGSIPFVVRAEELGEYRLFQADPSWN
jgi:hypothetical protein